MVPGFRLGRCKDSGPCHKMVLVLGGYMDNGVRGRALDSVEIRGN